MKELLLLSLLLLLLLLLSLLLGTCTLGKQVKRWVYLWEEFEDGGKRSSWREGVGEVEGRGGVGVRGIETYLLLVICFSSLHFKCLLNPS